MVLAVRPTMTGRTFVVTGMPGSGKEELLRVAIELGYKAVRMGDVVRSEAESYNVPMDDRGVGGFASDERAARGPGIWAERCVPHLTDGDALIDGSRSMDEMRVFRRLMGDRIRLLAVHASPAHRFERLKIRGRYDAPRDWQEFLSRDARELGWGVGSLIATADVMLVNDGRLEDFREAAREELARPW